jgi:hypothetical protein
LVLVLVLIIKKYLNKYRPLTSIKLMAYNHKASLSSSIN